MEINEDKLRKTYSQKETEKLIELKASGDLTELANSILDEELNARSVSSAEIDMEIQSQKVKEKLISEELNMMASRERRLVAHLIDVWGSVLILLVFNIGAFMVFSESIQVTVGKVSLVLWFSYVLFKDGWDGKSVGKRMLKIRVVENNNGSSCSLPKSFLRNFTKWLGIFDWIFIFGNNQKRLGDYLAGTTVVNLREG